MRKLSAGIFAAVIAVLATTSALAQINWAVAIEQHPMITTCGTNTNVPVAGATDCTTAGVAAQNLFSTLVQMGCLNTCPAGQNMVPTPPAVTCTPNNYTLPNGAQATNYQVSLHAECQTGGSRTGQIKVCKVAGPGVTVGGTFTFTVGTTTVTVPAGPAPGGTCALGPTALIGQQVTVHENIPPGNVVTSIAVAPPGNVIGAPNLGTGTVTVTAGPGVTEVTYTNENRTGYLEICKQGRVNGSFSFMVGNLGPFSVPNGACSPAIQVTAGNVVIHELTSANGALSGCATIPAINQGSCNTAAQTSTVTVSAGNVSTQTIAMITNVPRVINGRETMQPEAAPEPKKRK